MSVFLVAVLAALALPLSAAIYRVFFHPLAKYPGPWLAKMTRFYSAYHAWKGDIHLDMAKCHNKYGGVVRYAPNRLLFNSAQGIHDIYSYSSNVVKATSYSALLHGVPNILTMRDKTQHSKRRRIISQGLSDARMRALEPVIMKQIRKFCDTLVGDSKSPAVVDQAGVAAWGPARNMSNFCDYLAIDIMSSVIFSSQYEALTRPEYRWVPDAISESNVRVSVFCQVPEWKGFLKLDSILFPRAIEARNRFIGFIKRVLGDRLKAGKRENLPDIFSSLSDAKDDGGDGLAMQDLHAEAATLIVAGSDTTSTAMATFFFYLSRRADHYQTALAEVRGAFDSVDEIHSGPKLQGCTFLRACIDEALRIVPPAGSALWREVMPGGAVVDGNLIPAGHDVGVCVHAVHHNPELFPDPATFDPSRFLCAPQSSPGLGQNAGAKSAYAPFSLGPRSCLGKSLALTELMLTTATVLFLLDFQCTEGSELQKEFIVRDHVTAVKEGPMLQFRHASKV